MRFQRYLGVDYSGAQAPESRLRALQVYEAVGDQEPVRVGVPAAGAKHWSRLTIAQYCRQLLESGAPCIIGIDHGFSFPLRYLRHYGLASWDDFLRDFARHWPTADPHVRVEHVRANNLRTGDRTELRLCEQWTATAKSVFLFDVQGSVAKSTHAGLPWLLWLREARREGLRVHFWPFDGFEVPEGGAVVAEAYPALYKRRFPKQGRSADEHDAWSIAAWLQEVDRRGSLDRYFEPPLTGRERRQAELEGWILGVW